MSRIELIGATVEIEAGPVILKPTTVTLTEQRIGIIGGNGSGKSTLVRLLNNLITPTAGRVLVDGVDAAANPAAARKLVGFCFTDPSAQLVMPTCVEDVELSLRRSHRDPTARRDAAMAILTEYGLADRAHTSVHALSGGQRQLLALAGVLAVEPRVLVADEPTTLLDLANTRRVAERLFGLRQQLVLVSHNLELIELCERVLVVDRAEVVFDGDPQAAIHHYRALASEPAR